MIGTNLGSLIDISGSNGPRVIGISYMTMEFPSDFVLASGWSIMKYSLDLKEGNNIKLYWDYLITNSLFSSLIIL